MPKVAQHEMPTSTSLPLGPERLPIRPQWQDMPRWGCPNPLGLGSLGKPPGGGGVHPEPRKRSWGSPDRLKSLRDGGSEGRRCGWQGRSDAGREGRGVLGSGKGWRERPAFALSAPTHRVPPRPPISRAWSLTAVVFPMPWTWICEWPPFPVTTTTGTRSDLERGALEGCKGKRREAARGVPTLSSVGLGAGTQMGRGGAGQLTPAGWKLSLNMKAWQEVGCLRP